jgi:crotonobetainyl-CoA:carnitine CoA-transferase CaiB-like acyl-CoA transferase
MHNVKNPKSFLRGTKVLEIANELGEYCGKVLAGLGADVVKVEPAHGEETRTYGPFYHDEHHPDRSLHFWHYNLGKRSVVLDLDTEEGQSRFRRLAALADVVIDSRHRDYLAERGLGYQSLREINPGLVYLRISPFGDTGPWADFVASDLVQLALGGVMMNCGYDPHPEGMYETPPIAPQMWQAYHIAGEMSVMSVVAALVYRQTSGLGQALSTSIHDAVSKNSETDLPDWVFLRQPHLRQTCRHSAPFIQNSMLAQTKDGRYVMPYLTYLPGSADPWPGTVAVLKKFGMELDLEDVRYDDLEFRYSPESRNKIAQQSERLAGRMLFDADLWKIGQEHGLTWAPLRRPDENAVDEHWWARGALATVEHPELNEKFVYIGSKWFSREVEWQGDRRAPLVGEHDDSEIVNEWGERGIEAPVSPIDGTRGVQLSAKGKPFALAGVRVVDLSWLLASAGAGRYLAALGADVVKVEHSSRWDVMRFSLGNCPPGGRAERDGATEPLPTPLSTNPNRGGSFMEINSGKRSISLNLKHASGKQILEEMIRGADVVVEGFSPGTLERMGFGYERLRELNPEIIYVQQSGFGEHGTYGQTRAYGPTAAAFSGLSEMSGLPEPFPPAGIGYSYLDWFGAYNVANAILAALYRRTVSGEGCHIDASQAEVGLQLTGSAMLDRTVNGRSWRRYGNRSPFKMSAPHGAFPVLGDDRWIAISVFDDAGWRALVNALGNPDWALSDLFDTLESRIENEDELDRLLGLETQGYEPFELMNRLQAAGVAAGVCQTAQDRYETDPQLAHLDWLVELDQTEIGRWPVKEHPVKMSETPPYMGGPFDRSGPNYGEHTNDVLAELGYSDADIERLRMEGAL